MKTKFLLFILLTSVTIQSYAQEKKSVMATIVSLIKASKNEFADIKGELVTNDKENNIDYYACSESFGAGIEAISYEKNNNRCTSLCLYRKCICTNFAKTLSP